MAEYFFNWDPDVSKIIIDKMQDYFINKIKFSSLYPNFPGIRITDTHPFAYLMNQNINGTVVEANLFPSITVIEDAEQKNPELYSAVIESSDIQMGLAEVADINTNRSNYIITDDDLTYITSAVGTAQNETKIPVTTYSQHRRGSFVIEIWSENNDLKTKIYGLVRNFLLGRSRFTINQDYGIIIDEKSISGEKDGNYNFDFGKILYGSIIRFPLDYHVTEFNIDSTMGTVSEIIHFEGDING